MMVHFVCSLYDAREESRRHRDDEQRGMRVTTSESVQVALER